MIRLSRNTPTRREILRVLAAVGKAEPVVELLAVLTADAPAGSQVPSLPGACQLHADADEQDLGAVYVPDPAGVAIVAAGLSDADNVARAQRRIPADADGDGERMVVVAAALQAEVEEHPSLGVLIGTATAHYLEEPPAGHTEVVAWPAPGDFFVYASHLEEVGLTRVLAAGPARERDRLSHAARERLRALNNQEEQVWQAVARLGI